MEIHKNIKCDKIDQVQRFFEHYQKKSCSWLKAKTNLKHNQNKKFELNPYNYVNIKTSLRHLQLQFSNVTTEFFKNHLLSFDISSNCQILWWENDF